MMPTAMQMQLDKETILTRLKQFGLNPDLKILTEENISAFDPAEVAMVSEKLNQFYALLSQQSLGWFDKATKLWHKLPSFARHSLTSLSVVASIVSIPIHSSILFISGAGYISINLIFSNHFEANPVHNGHFAKTIQSLAEFTGALCIYLTCTQKVLGQHCQSLEESIKQLKEENKTLTQSIAQLNVSLQALQNTNSELITRQHTLQQQNEQYQKLNLDLEKQIKQLNEVKGTLATQVEELKKVKTQQQDEINKLHILNGTLEGSIRTMINGLQMDKKKREAFYQRLESFLKDETQSFERLAKRICKAEEQYASLNKEHQALQDRFEQTQKRLEETANRYERLNQAHPSQVSLFKPRDKAIETSSTACAPSSSMASSPNPIKDETAGFISTASMR